MSATTCASACLSLSHRHLPSLIFHLTSLPPIHLSLSLSTLSHALIPLRCSCPRRRTKHDIHPLQSNADPVLHPLEAAREYKRAVNAVKLERMFAKPFLGALDGEPRAAGARARALQLMPQRGLC